MEAKNEASCYGSSKVAIEEKYIDVCMRKDRQFLFDRKNPLIEKLSSNETLMLVI